MTDQLFTVSRSETYKLLHDGADVLIYEGGWWMKRSDYDHLWEYHLYTPPTRREDVGISRNEETHQLTTFICSIRPTKLRRPIPIQQSMSE